MLLLLTLDRYNLKSREMWYFIIRNAFLNADLANSLFLFQDLSTKYTLKYTSGSLATLEVVVGKNIKWKKTV